MNKISIIYTLKNRSRLLVYSLASIDEQDFDNDDIEICILDGQSQDNLLAIIDRWSDKFIFRFAQADRNFSYIPVKSNCPANEINLNTKYLASNDIIIKLDPEIVLMDGWLLQEIVDGIIQDPNRTYNARAHFIEGDSWYMDLQDILRDYHKHYHFAEGGPFSRSKYYFCCGFSKEKFIELGGVDELFCNGAGYDDDGFREMWKNRFGEYEKEISAQAIHLFHGNSGATSSLEAVNLRTFNMLKFAREANTLRIKDGKLQKVEPRWANPEMLSKIYTIKNGSIINESSPHENAADLNLPF